MGRKVDDKKITIKNYVVVVSLFIITGLIIITLANYYKDYREYYRSIPVIRGYVNEVSESELDNYLLENNDTIIYICKADAVKCRKFENKFKGYIKQQNLIDKTIYINLAKVKNKESFINKLNSKYKGLKEVDGYPAVIIIKNKTIIDLISGNISIDDANALLENYGMLGD